MLKIESNLKINGRHWGLAFVDGIAYTTNASLAAKLLLKGYVVTDEPVAGDIVSGSEISPTHAPLKQGEFAQLDRQPEVDQPVSGPLNMDVVQPEQLVSTKGDIVSNSIVSVYNPTVKADRPRTTKPRKKAVTADAADER